MRTPDFDELVGEDVDGAERERLRRVHDMLVAAGPPADIPATLTSPPVVGFRRRRVAAALLAAALAVAAFAGGWIARGGDESFEVRREVPMRGTEAAPVASGSLRLGYPDADGNWPMLVTVRGLRPLPEGGYYELLLTKEGKPIATCGTFKVGASGATTVRLGASYKLSEFDGWVVRPYVHGQDKLNKTVVLRT